MPPFGILRSKCVYSQPDQAIGWLHSTWMIQLERYLESSLTTCKLQWRKFVEFSKFSFDFCNLPAKCPARTSDQCLRALRRDSRTRMPMWFRIRTTFANKWKIKNWESHIATSIAGVNLHISVRFHTNFPRPIHDCWFSLHPFERVLLSFRSSKPEARASLLKSPGHHSKLKLKKKLNRY